MTLKHLINKLIFRNTFKWLDVLKRQWFIWNRSDNLIRMDKHMEYGFIYHNGYLSLGGDWFLRISLEIEIVSCRNVKAWYYTEIGKKFIINSFHPHTETTYAIKKQRKDYQQQSIDYKYINKIDVIEIIKIRE